MDFHGTDRTSATDVWLPIEATGRILHRPIHVGDRARQTFYELIGRLSPGASPALAQQQLRVTMAHSSSSILRSTLIEANPPTVYPGIGLPVAVLEQTIHTVRLLLGVVSVLLLITCANGHSVRRLEDRLYGGNATQLDPASGAR